MTALFLSFFYFPYAAALRRAPPARTERVVPTVAGLLLANDTVCLLGVDGVRVHIRDPLYQAAVLLDKFFADFMLPS